MRAWISALASLACAGCTSLFFQPDSHYYTLPNDWHADYEFVETRTPDGAVLSHWLLLSDAPRGTVIVLHGNAQNISAHAASTAWLVKAGYNVFLFEYRGFGQSTGVPSLDSIMRDLLFTFDQLVQRSDIAGKPVFILGQSLGGSIATYAVARGTIKTRLCALILEAPFADYRKIVRDKLATSWLFWALRHPLSLTVDNTYSPKKVVADVSPVPLLVVHSRDDRIVPSEHGAILFAAALEPKEFWRVDGPHVAYLSYREGRQRLVDYLDRSASQCKAGAGER